MTTTTINTDLLTPLGAYLRLRDVGRASFLLESVERGRLGRYSWMGAGSRHRRLRGGRGARAARRRLPRLRPCRRGSSRRCRCRRRAVTSRRAGSSSPRRSSASTTAPAPPTCSPATRTRSRDGWTAAIPWRREHAWRRRRRSGASPSASATSEMVRTLQGAHRRRRRVPDRALAARGAADVGLAARRLPRAPARQPVAVPLPARAGRDRARRLVAGAARRLRERPREPRARSPGRPSRPRATSSGCSRPRRTGPST